MPKENEQPSFSSSDLLVRSKRELERFPDRPQSEFIPPRPRRVTLTRLERIVAGAFGKDINPP